MPRSVRTAHVFEKKWRSDDVRLQEEASFSSLLLPEKILRGLENAGYKTPSPIQLESIPVGRFGRDLLVQAKSGTGKTLVFTIIALECLAPIKYPQVLIMAPTREIALQICDVVRAVGSALKGLTCNCFIGGLSVDNDIERVHGCQIVVGTPGRLKHLISRGILPTNSIRLLVMDEADVLLESSFKDDLDYIFVSLPKEKQVIATSATYPHKLKSLIYQYFRKVYLARLNRNELTLLGMVHYVQVLELPKMSLLAYKAKLAALEKVVTSVQFTQCLVFCNLISRVESLCYDIRNWGFTSTFISSAKEQCDRIKAIECLKRFKCKILVTSDVTSRGIDAENVDLVVNFDNPVSSEIYFHRCGRAGRYGAKGVAITFLEKNEVLVFEQLKVKHNLKAYNLPDPIPANLINIRPVDPNSSIESSEDDEYASKKVSKKDSRHMNCHSADNNSKITKESLCFDSLELCNGNTSPSSNGHVIEKNAVNEPASLDKDNNSGLSDPGEFGIVNEKDDNTSNKESSILNALGTVKNSNSEVVTVNGDNQTVSEISVATESVDDKNLFLEYLKSGPKNAEISSYTSLDSGVVKDVSTDDMYSQEFESNAFEVKDTDFQNCSQDSSEKHCMDDVNNPKEADNNESDSRAFEHSMCENEIKENNEDFIPPSDTLASLIKDTNTISVATSSPNTKELDKVSNEDSSKTGTAFIPSKIQLSVGKFLIEHMDACDVNKLNSIDFNISSDKNCFANENTTELGVSRTFKEIREDLTCFYSKVYKAYKAENLSDAALEDIKLFKMQQKGAEVKVSSKGNVTHSSIKTLSQETQNNDEIISKNIHAEPDKENDENTAGLKSGDNNVCDGSLYPAVSNDPVLSCKNKASRFGQVFERHVFEDSSAGPSSSSSYSDEDLYLTSNNSFESVGTSEKTESETSLYSSLKCEKEKCVDMKKKKFSSTPNKGQQFSQLDLENLNDYSSDEDVENMLRGACDTQKIDSRKQNFKYKSYQPHQAKLKSKNKAELHKAVRICDKLNRTLTTSESSEVSESESLHSSNYVRNTSTPCLKRSKSANIGYQHRTNPGNNGHVPVSCHHYGNASMRQPYRYATRAMNYGNTASRSQPEKHTASAANYGNFPTVNHQEHLLPSYSCSHQFNEHAPHNYRPNQVIMPHSSCGNHHQLRDICCQDGSVSWYQMYMEQWQFIHSSLF